MAEDFQTGICGGNWWNLSKSHVFMGVGVGGGSSPCSSTGINTSDVSGYGSWLVTDVVDLKPRSISCKDGFSNNNSHADNLSFSDTSVIFQDSQKPHQQQQQHPDSDSGGSSILMDSTLQMMGFGISSSSSSSSSDWTQTLLRGNGRGENSYNSILQEEMNSCQIQKDWSPKSYASTGEDSSINAFKAINNNNNQDFSLEQQRLNSLTNNSTATTTTVTTTTTTTTGGFSMGSASYGYPSTLIQSLFDPEPQAQLQPQPQQSLFNNNRTINNYSSPPPLPPVNYGTILNELSPSWPKLAPFVKPSLPIKHSQPTGGLHFSNNTPFWNASATALNDISTRPTFLTSSQPQFLAPTFEEKPHCPNLTTKSKNNEEARDSVSVVKKGSEPAFKRPRMETPSPLPTFKVRKEKLGDRITALQQLVSPFGKTDTASVLHEAIEYIKFLHDQVNVLSTPYMKNGSPIQHQQATEKMKEQSAEGSKQDLRSRGLCLVPISSTFPVANETTADFWTPTFGGSLR